MVSIFLYCRFYMDARDYKTRYENPSLIKRDWTVIQRQTGTLTFRISLKASYMTHGKARQFYGTAKRRTGHHINNITCFKI